MRQLTHYHYRWWYAGLLSVCVILMAFFYDVQPALLRLTAMRTMEKMLMKKIKHAQTRTHSLSPISHLPASTQEKMTALLHRLQQSGVSIQSAKVLSFSPTDMTVALVLIGHFQQMAAVMFALTEPSSPLKLTDFSLKVSVSSQLSLALTLTFFDTALATFINHQRPVLPTLQHNPFCVAREMNAISDNDALTKTQTIPLNLIKMVGYFAEGERQSALVLLPDHRVLLVEVKMPLGSEGAVITAIEQDAIRLTMPDHSEVRMAMERTDADDPLSRRSDH